MRAEKRADRLGSKTVAEVEPKKAAKASAQATPADTPERRPSPPPVTPVPPSAASRDELAAVQQLAASRLIELDNLRGARLHLEHQLDDLRIRVRATCRAASLTRQLEAVPDDIVAATAPYRSLEARYNALRDDTDRTLAEAELVQRESDTIREQQGQWRQTVLADAAGQIEEISQRLTKTDADLQRVRNQREDFRGEINDLKAREAEKYKQVEQIRTLANSRQDRVIALLSEVRRLKIQLAAAQSDHAAVEALAALPKEDDLAVAVSASLKCVGRCLGPTDRRREAEALNVALRDQLQAYTASSGSSALAESETATRVELGKLRDRVASLERVLAIDAPGGNPELSAMARRLEELDQRAMAAEAKSKASDVANEELVKEIATLSQAWQVLDQQNRDKVLNLVTHEERLTRLASEKAKADNRYFAAMRSKDAIAAESAVAVRTAASQLKTIEAYKESVVALTSRLTAAEKEITLQTTATRERQRRIAALEATTVELQARTVEQQRSIDQVRRASMLMC